MERLMTLFIITLIFIFASMMIPAMVLVGFQAYSAYDCWVQKDTENFSCFYQKGRSHRVKLKDLP